MGHIAMSWIAPKNVIKAGDVRLACHVDGDIGR
jgi:hypothetical protein